MKTMLTYAMTPGASFSELLTSKLTALYNKLILQKSTKLIMLLPSDIHLSKAELHKSMFDEIVVAKFDPTNAQFWKCKNLYKVLYFVNSTANMEYSNIYIDHGKVFKSISFIEDSDIICSNTLDNPDGVRHINKQLNDHCDLPLLDDDQIISYDFSAFYISDEIRSEMAKMLKQVAETFPLYIDSTILYAILSCLTAHIKQQHQCKVDSLNEDSIDIGNSGFVEDFYTLV